MRFVASRANRAVRTLARARARTIARIVRDVRGATAIEYGLILSLVVIALIVGLSALADSTTSLWNMVDTKVAQAH